MATRSVAQSGVASASTARQASVLSVACLGASRPASLAFKSSSSFGEVRKRVSVVYLRSSLVFRHRTHIAPTADGITLICHGLRRARPR